MDTEYGLLGDDEVLYVQSGRIVISNPTFKVSEFLDALAQLISENEGDWSDEREGWFTERGQSCEVLRFGNQGWQRGRIRIRLEFCPERPPKLLRGSTSADSQLEPGYQDDPYASEPLPPQRSRNPYGREVPSWQDDRPIYPDDEDF